MTTGIQDAVRLFVLDIFRCLIFVTVNLAWKLALAVKGHAAPGLLETYEEERLPVVAAMLLETTELHRKVYLAKGDEHKDQAKEVQSTIDALGRAAAPLAETDADAGALAQKDEPLFRGRKLFQLSVNYRWSSIVLDNQLEASILASAPGSGAKDVYGLETEVVRGGDCAPDAPGLEMLFKGPDVDGVSEKMKGHGPRSNPVRLFDIFSPTAHSVLVFSSGSGSSFVTQVQSVMRKLSTSGQKVAQTVIVVPSANSVPVLAGTDTSADLILSDKEGHAYRIYRVADRRDAVVAVRPDGVIGAYVHAPEELDKYFAKIFVH